MPGSPSSDSVSSPSLSSPALTNASTTSLSSGSDEATSFILAHKTRLLKRIVNSAPPRLPRRALRLPLPRRPSEVVVPPVIEEPEGYVDERTLYTDVYAGFPKRPKLRTEPGMKHPSLNATALLPDGLYKAKMSLHPQMIPSINWADLNVKVRDSSAPANVEDSDVIWYGAVLPRRVGRIRPGRIASADSHPYLVSNQCKPEAELLSCTNAFPTIRACARSLESSTNVRSMYMTPALPALPCRPPHPHTAPPLCI